MSLTEQGLKRSAADSVSRALERSMAGGDGLLERLPVGVYSSDANGVLVQYNEGAAVLWCDLHIPLTALA